MNYQMHRPATFTKIVLALSIIVPVAGCGGGNSTKGPMVVLPSQAAGYRTTLAHPFTFGDIYVTNSGNKPITLWKVSLVAPSPGVSIVGTAVRHATMHTFSLAGDANWPPSSSDAKRYYTGLQALRGFVIPAPTGGSDPGAQILVGISQNQAGRGLIKSFEITYRSGSDTFIAVVPYSVAMCVEATGMCRLPALPKLPDSTAVEMPDTTS